MKKLLVFSAIALLVAGCYIVQDDYESLWQKAYAYGEGRIFLAQIDEFADYQSFVWVSAAAHSYHIALELAEGRGMKKLGSVHAYIVDSRFDWDEGYYHVDVLMTVP